MNNLADLPMADLYALKKIMFDKYTATVVSTVTSKEAVDIAWSKCVDVEEEINSRIATFWKQ